MIVTTAINFSSFLKDLFNSRKIIFELTKKDFSSVYLGSYLGIAWAFLNPVISIFIFWFVFQVGFKSTPVDNFPFILWLISGMIPWFFFASSISTATGCILEKKYLVQKVVFRVSILPIIKILSALFVHLFFVCLLMIIFMAYGHTPTYYSLQIFYYLFAMLVLLLGLSWISSALVIFFKDTEHIIAMFLQFGFWLTPVFWSLKMIPAKYHAIIKLNPVYYIIEGYRDSFIYKTWFWEHWTLTIYFWILTSIIFVLGAVLFRRLRPHFADVL